MKMKRRKRICSFYPFTDRSDEKKKEEGEERGSGKKIAETHF